MSFKRLRFFKKKVRRRYTMLTAYDAPTAALLERAGVDMLLVGDSLGMVVLGYDSTAPVTMEEMIHHAKAVRRGAPRSPVIADMPLKGIERGPAQALASARRFIREAGADAVKVEWGPKALAITRLLTSKGIAVMGHVGLTPQTLGFKVRGATAEQALDIVDQALAFENAGAFSVLLECVPSPVAALVTRRLRVPTVGIGAGPHCAAQVLVFHDLVGIFKKFSPRFVKRYAELDAHMERAVRNYVTEVRRGVFPAARHAFSMKPDERKKMLEGAGSR